MQSMGIDPQIMPADIDEAQKVDEKPLALVKRLAQEKAIAVCYKLMEQPNFEQLNNEIVLAADTIVWTDDGQVFGKPVDAEDAKRMLSKLSGQTHHVSTGVALRRFKAFKSPSPDGAPSVVAVDLVTIFDGVAIGVRLGWVSLVNVDFLAVGQAIAIGVRVGRVSLGNVDFLVVGQTVAVGIAVVWASGGIRCSSASCGLRVSNRRRNCVNEWGDKCD